MEMDHLDLRRETIRRSHTIDHNNIMEVQLCLVQGTRVSGDTLVVDRTIFISALRRKSSSVSAKSPGTSQRIAKLL